MGEEVFAYIFPLYVSLFSLSFGGELIMNGKEFLRERYGLLDNLVKLIGKELVEEREGRWDFLCLRYLLNELGKKEAWEYIWHRCEGTVKKAIGFYFKGRKDISKEDKEDVYCEIRWEVYKSIESYKGKGSLDGYIWKIGKRVIKRWLKGRGKVILESSLESPLEEMIKETVEGKNGRREEIRRELFSLPKIYAEVLSYHLEGYSSKEIGIFLSCPEGTVRWRLSEAKRRLRVLLEEENFIHIQQNGKKSTHYK